MKVHVIGSSRSIKDQEGKIKFDSAGRELGKELADRGHTILVGTDDEDDVDPSVVFGALEDSSNKVPIEVHVPHGEKKQYPDLSDQYPQVKTIWHQFNDWNVTFMEVIRDNADVVLAIGGRQFTIQLGTSAWMMGIPIVPIGSFEHGSKKLWKYGSSRRQDFYQGAIKDYEIDRLSSPWEEGSSAKFIVDVLERVVTSVNRARTPHRVLVLEFILMVLALLGWAFFLVFPSIIDSGGWLDNDVESLGDYQHLSLILMFAAVVSAGLFGASMSTLRRINSGAVITTSRLFIDTMLGIAAGFVSAMLYLLAQIGLNGSIDASMTEDDYIRVTIIVSMASLFAALYLDAAFSRFSTVRDSVMAGTFK